MYNRFRKIFCIIIPISLLLASCSHTPEVTKPSNGSKADWLAYYEDQFEAFGDEVEVPPKDVPEAQMQAYLEAKDSFESAETTGTIVSYAVLAIGLSALIVTLTQL